MSEYHVFRKWRVKNGRRLIVHSFRFTCVTFMRRELPTETVMKLVEYRRKKIDKRKCNQILLLVMDAAFLKETLKA